MSIITFTFSRRFYPKRLRVHSGYTIFDSMCVPWELNPKPLALLTQCTEPQEHLTLPPVKKSIPCCLLTSKSIELFWPVITYKHCLTGSYFIFLWTGFCRDYHFYQKPPSACCVSNASKQWIIFLNRGFKLFRSLKTQVSPITSSVSSLECLQLQEYDASGVEHIPVVQIDLSVPLKVPGEQIYKP